MNKKGKVSAPVKFTSWLGKVGRQGRSDLVDVERQKRMRTFKRNGWCYFIYKGGKRGLL